jgi:hypothetical protein
VEGDEGKRVKVNVVLELLRRRVVLVVLVAPPRPRHAAAEAVDGDLDRAVDADPASQRVVPTLVHEPAAAALHDAEQHNAGEHPPVIDERCARQVHPDHLREAVDDVADRRLKLALGLELGGEGLKVGEQRGAARLVAFVQGARRQRLEHLVRLGRAHVELLVRVGRVSADLIRDDLAAGVAADEGSHVVSAIADHELLLLLRGRLALEDVGRRGRGVRVRVARSHLSLGRCPSGSRDLLQTLEDRRIRAVF